RVPSPSKLSWIWEIASPFHSQRAGGGQSRWVEIGQSFLGHKLERYDREKQTLYLKDDNGKKIVIALSSSSYQPDDMDALTKAEEVMRLSNFQKLIKETIALQGDAMAQSMKQMAPEGVNTEAFADLQKRILNLISENMDLEKMEAGMATAYAEVFTPEELDGFIDFYDTPAGKASIEKMPAIQQKSLQVMMPELIKITPLIQKLSQEWLEEQMATQSTEE
ncbi:MAG: DUF2059 domain-containing protein, partial [Opitutales bacterium]|nr:DUF2059 domain-containing protein [Opitutales bacterium]